MFDIDKSNFSFIDLFAYIIPGAIALFFIGSFGIVERISYDGVLDCYDKVLQQWSSNASMINSIWFLLASYVAGHLVSFLSCITVEAYSHWRYKYPSDFLMLRSRLNEEKRERVKKEDVHNPNACVTWVLKVLIGIGILPISLYDIVLGGLLDCRYYFLKPLDRIYTDVIDDRISTLMSRLKVGNKQIEESPNKKMVVLESDAHRIAYHYELEKLVSHQKKLDGYIALYDFLRAISLISVGVFWGSLYILIHDSMFSTSSIICLFFLSFLPFIFFIMFMKFYRRHTLETFMCLITDEELCETEN